MRPVAAPRRAPDDSGSASPVPLCLAAMTPAAFSSQMRQLRAEAERVGWDEAAEVVRRAETAVAAGHLSGRSRWHRRARKAITKLAGAALSARVAADRENASVGQPTVTAEQMIASLPDDPARLATEIRKWASDGAYKDERAEFLDTADQLDAAAADIRRAAEQSAENRRAALEALGDVRQRADDALSIIGGLLDEAAAFARPAPP